MFYVIIGEDVVGLFEVCLVICFVYFEWLYVLQVEVCLILVGFCLVIDLFDFGLVGFLGSIIIVEFVLLVVV